MEIGEEIIGIPILNPAPTDSNDNPLTDKKYSTDVIPNTNPKEKPKTYLEEYKELAELWTKYPVYKECDKIVREIRDHQVVVITSGTGSGKTVLVPKLALHAVGYDKKVVTTFPRQKITLEAAVFAAKTTGVKLEDKYVGYKYRGSGKTFDSTTKLLYATDGIIVAELLNKNKTTPIQYDVVIIDEAHERNIQIDQLLYLLKMELIKKKKLKIIIMSATIDPESFVNYFKMDGIDPIHIDLEGTQSHHIFERYIQTDQNKLVSVIKSKIQECYDAETERLKSDPVSINDIKQVYKIISTSINEDEKITKLKLVGKIQENTNDTMDKEQIKKIEDIKKRLFRKDILVFVGSGEEAKNFCSDKEINEKFECIRVDSQMSDYTKRRIMETTLETPESVAGSDEDNIYTNIGYNAKSKLLIATNIAESSITFNNLRYVIDTGYEFQESYDPVLGAKCLRKKMVSQSQMKQRRGRVGRTSDGVYIGLYNEDLTLDDSTHPKFPVPKIRSSDISLLILQLLDKHYKIDIVLKQLQQFISPPRQPFIIDGIKRLISVGAIDNMTVTRTGTLLNKTKLDPLLGLVLLYGIKYNCEDDIIKIISVLEGSGGQIKKLFKNQEKVPKTMNSDHLFLLQIYNDYEKDEAEYESKKKEEEEKLKDTFDLQIFEDTYKSKIFTRTYNHRTFKHISDNIEYYDKQSELIKKKKKKIRVDSEVDKYMRELDDNKTQKILFCFYQGFRGQIAESTVNNNYYVPHVPQFRCQLAENTSIKTKFHYVMYNEMFVGDKMVTLNIVSDVTDFININPSPSFDPMLIPSDDDTQLSAKIEDYLITAQEDEICQHRVEKIYKYLITKYPDLLTDSINAMEILRGIFKDKIAPDTVAVYNYVLSKLGQEMKVMYFANDVVPVIYKNNDNINDAVEEEEKTETGAGAGAGEVKEDDEKTEAKAKKAKAKAIEEAKEETEEVLENIEQMIKISNDTVLDRHTMTTQQQTNFEKIKNSFVKCYQDHLNKIIKDQFGDVVPYEITEGSKTYTYNYIKGEPTKTIKYNTISIKYNSLIRSLHVGLMTCVRNNLRLSTNKETFLKRLNDILQNYYDEPSESSGAGAGSSDGTVYVDTLADKMADKITNKEHEDDHRRKQGTENLNKLIMESIGQMIFYRFHKDDDVVVNEALQYLCDAKNKEDINKKYPFINKIPKIDNFKKNYCDMELRKSIENGDLTSLGRQQRYDGVRLQWLFYNQIMLRCLDELNYSFYSDSIDVHFRLIDYQVIDYIQQLLKAKIVMYKVTDKTLTYLTIDLKNPETNCSDDGNAGLSSVVNLAYFDNEVFSIPNIIPDTYEDLIIKKLTVGHPLIDILQRIKHHNIVTRHIANSSLIVEFNKDIDYLNNEFMKSNKRFKPVNKTRSKGPTKPSLKKIQSRGKKTNKYLDLSYELDQSKKWQVYDPTLWENAGVDLRGSWIDRWINNTHGDLHPISENIHIHYERQDRLQCGRHAINHLIANSPHVAYIFTDDKTKTDDELNDICISLKELNIDKRLECDREDGNYNVQVLEVALKKRNYNLINMFTYQADDIPSVKRQKILNTIENCFDYCNEHHIEINGFLINIGGYHWTAICSTIADIDGHVYFDSQFNEPLFYIPNSLLYECLEELLIAYPIEQIAIVYYRTTPINLTDINVYALRKYKLTSSDPPSPIDMDYSIGQTLYNVNKTSYDRLVSGDVRRQRVPLYIVELTPDSSIPIISLAGVNDKFLLGKNQLFNIRDPNKIIDISASVFEVLNRVSNDMLLNNIPDIPDDAYVVYIDEATPSRKKNILIMNKDIGMKSVIETTVKTTAKTTVGTRVETRVYKRYTLRFSK